MSVEVLCIGTELLLGNILNGNARWLIVVGDVAGHGLSAALLVTWCRAAVPG